MTIAVDMGRKATKTKTKHNALINLSDIEHYILTWVKVQNFQNPELSKLQSKNLKYVR